MTYVWRANSRYRMAGAGLSLLLVLLSINILIMYGWYAALGVALVMAAVVRTYWVLLRPSLTAGPSGVRVVWERSPVQLTWKEIRRVEPTMEGLKISCDGGREIVARYPQKPPRPSKELTEADIAAAYLAQRAAWARKPAGPEPTYTAPPPPVKKAKA